MRSLSATPPFSYTIHVSKTRAGKPYATLFPLSRNHVGTHYKRVREVPSRERHYGLWITSEYEGPKISDFCALLIARYPPQPTADEGKSQRKIVAPNTVLYTSISQCLFL